ncbi:MAG TPA: GAF domain-containing sensor histidine kinase [Candidatus Binatia bacterium]|nr:GAF domain-containing sensor histidine kinase [Candidatus Binatia bacterium]
MRSVSRSLSLANRGSRRTAPLEAFSRTEKIIAFCRVLLAVATLGVAIIDPKQPSFRPDLAYIVLYGYVAYSFVLFLLVRGEYLRQEWIGISSMALDVAWICPITIFTEGGTSPFFLLHVFVISSVSVRWGFRATMLVTIVLALLYPTVFMLASPVFGSDIGFRRVHLFRPVYLLTLAYLIGYLGEHERRSKRKLGFMLELPAAFRRGRPPGRALSRLMRRTLDHFGAQRGVLVLRDPETGRYFTWDVQRRGGRVRLGLRITEVDPFPLPFAADTEGLLVNDLRPGSGTALCYDVLTGVVQRKAIVPVLALPEAWAAEALLVAPVLIQRELRGHAVVLREARRKFTRDDLEFLLLLVGQAASGFENVRLQEKAEEFAVSEERGRIARDLHDGFIQSLAGIDLRVEACKLLLQRDPTRVKRELEELHQAVDRGYREVRHYLTVLREPRHQEASLWSSLDRLAAEFSTRERLGVRIVRPSSDPELTPATTHDLTQIVREALRNAVRHGQASEAVIKITCRPSHLSLVVHDNGSGFTNGHARVDDDGFLAPQATPWSIRERTAALGGSLRVWTKPGRGAEITVTIPAAGRGRYGADRRMHA